MADARLKIVIDAVNNAKGALDGVKRDLGGLEQPAKRGGAAFDKLTRSLSMAAVAGAALKLGDMVYDLGVLGAEAERVEASFIKIAGGADEAATTLETLKRATGGARSEVELMSGATTVMALGLADNADQLAQIVRNVESLGSRFGGTMQTFQLMMANDSLMRIDSFGISVEEATERIDEFKRAGMDAGDAFDTAVLELMNEKFESFGGIMDDNKLAIDRMKASVTDLKNEIGKGLAPTVAQVATNMTDLISASRRAAEEYGFWGVAADILVEGILDVNDTIHTQIDDAEALIETELKATAATDGYAAMLAYHNEQQTTAAQKASEAASAQGTYKAAIEGTWGAISGVTGVSDDHILAMQSEGKAAADAAIAFYEAAAGLQEMSKVQFAQAQIDALIAAGVEGEKLADAMHAIYVEAGILTAEEETTQGTLNRLKQAAMEGTISWDAWAAAVMNTKNNLDAIDSKTVTVDIVYNDPGWSPNPGSKQVPGENRYEATGGQFWTTHPTRLTVGEGGQPELVTVTPATQVSNTWNVNFQGMNSQGAVGAVRMLQALYGAR